MVIHPLTFAFWPKVNQEGPVLRPGLGPCWLWARGRAGSGYGELWDGAKPRYAHRVSWEIHAGSIPLGLCVLHRCDNPPCVNPAHLFLGTHADNAHDRSAKGRSNTRPLVSRQESSA